MLTVKQLREWLADYPDCAPIEAANFKDNVLTNVELMIRFEDETGQVIATIGVE